MKETSRKMSGHPRIVWHKKVVGMRNRIRNNQTRNNVARRTPKGRRLQVEPEGSIGVKDKHTRRRLHPGNERKASQTLRMTLGLGIG
jgi:hypothetical protein